MQSLSFRSRYALLLLALGFTPEEAAARVRERLGIELSPNYLRNLRYRAGARAFVDSVRPAAVQSALATLLAPSGGEEVVAR